MFNRRLIRGLSLILFICLTVQACGSNSSIPKSVQTNQPVQSQQSNFDLSDIKFINDKQGWLLLDGQLFWTNSSGENWSSITPASLGGWSIAEADFVSPSIGWLVLVSIDSDGTNHIALSKTTNGGKSWDFHSLLLFSPGDPASIAGKISFFALDQQTLWFVVKRQSGAAFNSGTLFRSQDGGESWVKLDIPGGDPVLFIDSQKGWTVAGSGEDLLYSTQDGGSTWEPQEVLPASDATLNYQLPFFDASGHGLLPIYINQNTQNRLAIYQSADYGKTWALSSDTKINTSTGQNISFSIPPDGQWTAVLADGQVLQGSIKGTETMAHANLIGGSKGTTGQSLQLGQPLPVQGIYHLDMVSETNGWAVSQSGDCSNNSTAGNAPDLSRSCSTAVNLLQTTDGGLTWKTLALPATGAASPSALSNQITTVSTQGFDTCEVPTTDQMSTWIAHSPYKVFNLYIGGSWLGCKAAKMSLITNDYIGQLSQEGWKFTPTWVGLQAPCYCPSCNKPQMSSNTSTAYSQGVTEANSALQTAAKLGLTGTNQANTIIYYDLEAFDFSNSSCTSAVKSFLEGWTHQLHAKSDYSGVYSTSCALAKLSLSQVANVPDDVWLAYWLTPFQYRSNASVYNVYCYSETVFTNHQRIHQYSGEHSETWNGVSIAGLDNNVYDGAVAGWTNSRTDCPQSGGVILYWNSNFGCSNATGDTGYRMRQTTGWINVNDGSFDNKTASIKVPACFTVNLYSEINLGGGSITINSDVADLSALGNYPTTTIAVIGSVSSILVYYDPDCQNNYFPFIPYFQ